jgi:arylsulfatase A-like enzyme
MPARPDILWIVTTQWRGQACGFAGDPNARTPHLDAFAHSAVVFERAFSNHPFGPFARALLLTGRLSPGNGVSDYWDPLPRNSETLAHRLSAAGYATAFFGKWHLAPRDRTAPVVGETHARQLVAPEDRGGFEFWEGFESGFQLNDPWLHGTRLPEPTRFPGYQADILCSRATAWLVHDSVVRLPSSSVRSPQFTVVSLESPHPPYAAAVPADIPSRDPATLELAPNVPRGGAVEATARRELAGYYRHIEATDRAIGHLLASVDLSSTAVFITSAHGDMHGARGLFRKGWPYEESIRVPLVARWPGSGAPRILTPVSLADLPATALVLAGSTIPADWPGNDLRQVPRDTDRRIPLAMPSAPPFEKQCPHAWSGWRSRDELRVFRADGRPWLHFDLRADPQQERNLVPPGT